MTGHRDDDDDDKALEAAVAQELARRGELIPTTEAEVRAAERAGVAFEGDLPDELVTLRDRRPISEPAPSARVLVHEPATSHRVLSLQELRRARDKRKLGWSHVATFGLGMAAAAAFLLFAKLEGPGKAVRDPAGGPLPPASASATPAPEPIVVPPVRACSADCCAGAGCGAAQGELRACASNRDCVPCGDAPASAYRVRLGNLVPTKLLDDAQRASLDVCARVGAGAWSCFPAIEEPKAQRSARTLASLASSEDLAAGIEAELRPRGQKTAVGTWRSSVRLAPTVLCRGLGGALANEKGEHYGSLPILLDDPYFVEIARAADVEAIKTRRAAFVFGDVTPRAVETRETGDRRFALVVGPTDRATAEKLRWSLLERSVSASTELGVDHVGEPLPLP